MIKAVFFDIDGTLIDHNHGSVVPASTRQALWAMHEKGIKLFVATGRMPSMLSSGALAADYPFDGYVTLNGQYVFTREKEVIRRASHRPEAIQALLSLLKHDDFPALIVEEQGSFGCSDCEEIREHYRWCGLPMPPLYDPARLETHPVYQFLAYIPWEERDRLASIPYIEPTSAGGNILDVIPQGGGKEVGIAAAAAHYGFERESIMVFGDGVNDVRMLRWAGTGVALGSGAEEAKAAADYVTSPIWDDGVKNALLHYHVLSPEDFAKK